MSGSSFRHWPTALYDAIMGGSHFLVLREGAGGTVGATVVTQAEIEEARARVTLSSDDFVREGWARTPHWQRWMRIEVARLLQAVAVEKLPCALEALCQEQSGRGTSIQAIETMSCRFACAARSRPIGLLGCRSTVGRTGPVT
jgi:hypothetical protein